MSCMFFSFVLVYLYVLLCTLMWKNGYAERYEFKQKSINHNVLCIQKFLANGRCYVTGWLANAVLDYIGLKKITFWIRSNYETR